ncbi:MAG: glycosyltransferase family 4 protein, partial [Aggregatilineales bacterium]
LVQLYRQLKPDLVHHVSIKPVLYGGLAAKFAGRPAVVSAMSGLGYVFIGDTFKSKLIRLLVRPFLYPALSGKCTRMIFQNTEDRQHFINMGLIDMTRAALIRGSGVDMTQFTPQPEPDDTVQVLFAGRLMWKKGVGDFVEAAKRLQGQAKFVIVGYAEASSPDNVPPEQLKQWQDAGFIEWWGKRDDMPDIFAASHLVCLPSSYGEGVPKVLIEAAASGRAIVTTDTPGCRDIVRHNHNGLLVPPGDTDALTEALHRLIQDNTLRQQMGKYGRNRAVNEFSLEIVNQQSLQLYADLLKNTANTPVTTHES